MLTTPSTTEPQCRQARSSVMLGLGAGSLEAPAASQALARGVL